MPPKNQPTISPKAGPPAEAPKNSAVPPPEYYVEPPAVPGDNPNVPPPGTPPPPPTGVPPSPPGAPPPPPTGEGPQIYEPAPPGFYAPGEPVYEPFPPPAPRHIAPRTSLWLGARVGWFIPFGSVYSRGTSDANGDITLKGVPWRRYASSGPMFEIDAGARLSRNYNVFALWERAQLGSGSGDPESGIPGSASSADTDFWGVGIRALSDPDRTSLVTELAIGYRRAHSKYGDGTDVQFTDAPFEARLGLGADIRLNPVVTLSPMVTAGVGSFGKVERKSNGAIADQIGSLDQADGHAWITLTFGATFDLLGSMR